ncbi:Ig-like domain-containing protein [uncultured Paraglaciecola sp.]|uniref:Ig-like domain-containing protein n=1 Tax=uncultured Paraglaciecola sp. TaxID=1765024 RepID=UPI0030DA0190|tara:strand:- start:312306 stop:314615 length:2310 start_codon:yes stop_codon:yes gene_type:complete
MILRFRTLLVFLALLSLFSCGGGGEISRDDSTGSTGGGGTVNVTRNVELEFTDANGQSSKDLNESNPLTLTATAIDSNGDPVADTLITFTFQPEGLAIFGNDSGTASTGNDGVASIDILVGENSGDGVIIATLSSGETDDTTFKSSGTTRIGVIPASIELYGSSTQLASSGSDEIELIAQVKDANNVLLEGVTVTFSANSSASLQITQGITGADGIATALLDTQNKPENRTITVAATASGLAETKTLDIQVVGTSISVNGPPTVIVGETATFTIFLSDFDGVGIANQIIQVESQQGNGFDSNAYVTDGEGQVVVNYTANSSGLDLITASALNANGALNVTVQQDQFSFTEVSTEDIPLGTASNIELTWLKDTVPFANGTITLTTTRGTLSATNVKTNSSGKATFQIQSSNAGRAIVSAQGVDSSSDTPVYVNVSTDIEFVATQVNNIILSASPNSIGPAGQKSTITAVLRDAAGNLVKGKTVNFNNDDVSGGEIFPASAITDSNGVASTVYTSSSVTTENGITISATEPDSNIMTSLNLTVANRSQFISIGTGNVISSPDETSYLKKFTVFVTDANSNPVSGVELTVTGTPVKYSEILEPNAEPGDANYQAIRPAFYKGYWVAYPNQEDFEFWTAVRTVGCANEDVDDDAIEDPNEDVNGDGELTPGNILSIDGDIVTDENGQAIIELRYAKTYAAWGQVKITASTPVSGSESQASQFFLLSASSTDLREEATPPNTNPFGRGLNSVEDPNNPGTFIDDGANLTCENTL